MNLNISLLEKNKENNLEEYKTKTDKEALEKIKTLLAPGQEFDIHQAIDVMAECYTIARLALERDKDRT